MQHEQDEKLNRLLHTKGSIKDLTRIAKELDDNPLQIASAKQIPGDLIHQEDIVSALEKFREEYPSKTLHRLGQCKMAQGKESILPTLHFYPSVNFTLLRRHL